MAFGNMFQAPGKTPSIEQGQELSYQAMAARRNKDIEDLKKRLGELNQYKSGLGLDPDSQQELEAAYIDIGINKDHPDTQIRDKRLELEAEIRKLNDLLTLTPDEIRNRIETTQAQIISKEKEIEASNQRLEELTKSKTSTIKGKQQPQAADTKEISRINERITILQIEKDKLKPELELLATRLEKPENIEQDIESHEKQLAILKRIAELENTSLKGKREIGKTEAEHQIITKVLDLKESLSDIDSESPVFDLVREIRNKYYGIYNQIVATSPQISPKAGSEPNKAVFQPKDKSLGQIKRELENDLNRINEQKQSLSQEQQEIRKYKRTKIHGVKSLSEDQAKQMVDFIEEQKKLLKGIETAMNTATADTTVPNIEKLLDIIDKTNSVVESEERKKGVMENELLMNELLLAAAQEHKPDVQQEQAAQKTITRLAESLPPEFGNLLLNPPATLENLNKNKVEKLQGVFKLVAEYGMMNDQEKESLNGKKMKSQIGSVLKEVSELIPISTQAAIQNAISKGTEEAKDQSISPDKALENKKEAEQNEKKKNKIIDTLKEIGPAVAGIAGWSILMLLIALLLGSTKAVEKLANIEPSKGIKV